MNSETWRQTHRDRQIDPFHCMIGHKEVVCDRLTVEQSLSEGIKYSYLSALLGVSSKAPWTTAAPNL